ncbi:MAG: hypothetical protein J6A28_01425 [Clostridia bacterium]|nr:hypothetical protein [Clostridia bacterium]
MKKTRNFTNKTFLKLAAFLCFPCALFGGAMVSAPKTANAEQTSYSYSEGHREANNVTNPSFVDGARPFASDNALTGWSVIEQTKAKGMIIDVGNKIESDDKEIENTTFSNHKDTYMLETNPETKDKNDTRILMINSKSSSSQRNVETRKGYKSSTLSLKANSYYVFYVSAKTMLNGDSYAQASIYLSGMKDKEGNDLAFEKIESTTWGDYYFFVATGDKDADVNLQLYLGSKDSDSSGVALFDATSVYRYSENEFYDLCYNYGYKGLDEKVALSNGQASFLVNENKTKANIVEETANYNFNFEDETALFNDNWTLLAHPNGTAQIINYADFAATTGLPRIGNDLSYDNNRALVMQTTASDYSSYIGIKSKNITIAPHAAYKVSLKVKIANMESGSFYLKLTEGDYIYSVYSDFVSDEEKDDNYLALSSGKTNGITSNTTDVWTNDYQTIDYYVKGHSLYTSKVNVELWLGDSETSAVGCVVVDDIQVERVADSEIDSADCLTLKSNTEETSFTNASFDTTTNSDDNHKYPLTATGWTNSKESDLKCEAGVVYLDENIYEGAAESVYDLMYDKATYNWAGINPKNANGNAKPSNVYMMFNREDSYQTLKSPSFSLNGQEYYKVSFKYYNQLYKTTTPSSIRVEVVDSTGIILFSQAGISSLDEWAQMDIFFHTATTKAHEISLNIYFGESSSPARGLVYLDNFAWTSATADEFGAAAYKTDMTGFYTKLDTVSSDVATVVESSAYTFSATSHDSNFSSANCGFGGVVRGTDNAYGITNEKDNFLALTSYGASTLSLKSKFTKEFEADTYYKLTFSLATILGKGETTEDHDCSYGVTIKLEGYGEIANLITDGALKDYTIYFKATDSATSPTLEFILNSDCDLTTGSALLTNLLLEKTDGDRYIKAQNIAAYGESVFTSEYEGVEDDFEEPDLEDKEDEPVETENTTNWGIIASSLITSLAVVIGVIALAFRSIKLKKINKVKASAYDKRLNENHELIMSQAQKLRDQEVANLQAARKAVEEEKATTEQEHKEFIRVQREKDKGKISKTVEKAFKQYTSRIATLNEKIKILNEKIDYVMTADHLIEIERKIVANEDDKKSKKRKSK